MNKINGRSICLGFELPVIVSVVILLVLFIGCSSTPDTDQIKADLIGKTMGDMFSGGWHFASINEITSIKIIKKQQLKNFIEYTCDMRLRDMNTGKRYSARALISYKKTGGTWKFVSVKKLSYEED